MHVAVLGAGYAGLRLTRRLERRLPNDVDLTLVDESPHHLLQHELHRVVRNPSLADDVVVSLEATIDRATVELDTVESVDPDDGIVRCSRGQIEFDVGAVCLGARTDFHGLPGVREHATPLKRLEHAIEIRENYLDLLEVDDPRVVVGGAGLSGVQVAGELAALARERDANVSILLLEALDRVAPAFPREFGRAVRDALESAGVTVRTDAPVSGADDTSVHLTDGETIPHDLFVWTGGIRGSDALGGERPTVRSDLRLGDRTFALGDAAHVIDDHGQAVPASAQAATRQAKTVAENVERLVRDRLHSGENVFEPRLERFTFDSPGWVVSIGDDAVGQFGPTVVTGRAAMAMKATVDAGYLTSIGAVGEAVESVSQTIGRAGLG